MDEQQALQEMVGLARAFLNKQRSALETGQSISSYGPAHLTCWEPLGGAHGPLGAFYGADDDAEKQHFLSSEVGQWHPSVKDAKRAALVKAEEFWEPKVQAACDALIQYAAKLGVS